MKTIIINGDEYKGSDIYGELYGCEITIDELYQTYINNPYSDLDDLENKDTQQFIDYINLQFT